ncbi:DUF2777 family protein [Evansella cellulosilytica]|uniref:DUF2777 family protein n=1 Tax=Evansella cellulosilytica (strain ATCC 21833 / DSM 2522 / FERM P-1141 / JCM 9156 / N-4) TaxID=649639 RepID=E6U078_EVAC2|nr:DUF2777 family protein [Evansella cellulosilytica]ADU30194.1 hypothetical protein Bcell_1932 [Evansella cellulosilytica DSM 2522]
MDRKTAKHYIGEQVILNEGKNGQYVGILEDMKTEPNKPWTAFVRIKGVYEYPEISLNELELNKPFLKDNDIFKCSGQKIEPISTTFPSSYDESLKYALKLKWDQFQQINEDSEIVLSLIQQELRKLKGENLLFEESYIYYQIVKKGRQVFIYEEEKHESLSIEECPFEFEIHVEEKWLQAHYISGLTFELNNGKQIDLSHGSTVRLNKTQFDPYQILLNELDSPSLHALEKGLQKFGLGHEHSVYCHNALLVQMLSSLSRQEFKGVNFISYSNAETQYVVQHHFERTIRENDDDITYDRFEFTSDTGERVLTSYATQFSAE